MAEDNLVGVSFEELKKFCKQAYVKAGVPAEEAESVTDFLTRADLRGVETHGVTPCRSTFSGCKRGMCRRNVK